MRPAHPNILHSRRIVCASQFCPFKPGRRFAQQRIIQQTDFDLLLLPGRVPNPEESGASMLFRKRGVALKKEIIHRMARARVEGRRGMDKVPARGSPSRSAFERRRSFSADGRSIRTGHAAARRAASRDLDFVYSPVEGTRRQFGTIFKSPAMRGRLDTTLQNAVLVIVMVRQVSQPIRQPERAGPPEGADPIGDPFR